MEECNHRYLTTSAGSRCVATRVKSSKGKEQIRRRLCGDEEQVVLKCIHRLERLDVEVTRCLVIESAKFIPRLHLNAAPDCRVKKPGGPLV